MKHHGAKYNRRVQTDFYTPTETNSAEDFNPEEIQDKIDKQVQWEMDYYEWLYYKGDEADRPKRPGPHPDPKHEWNINPEKLETIQDTNADDSSDYIWSQIQHNNDYLETKSDCQKSKIFFEF